MRLCAVSEISVLRPQPAAMRYCGAIVTGSLKTRPDLSRLAGDSEVVLKMVNSSKSARTIRISLGSAAATRDASLTVLASDDLKAGNSLDQPKKVAPVEGRIAAKGSDLDFSLSGNSLTVLRVPIR